MMDEYPIKVSDEIIYHKTLGRDPANFTTPKQTRLSKLLSILAFPTTYVKAADFARYQQEHEVDYKKLYDGGYRLVIIKATEGTTYVDPLFAWHWPRALDNGLMIMMYHFFYGHQSGVNQAEWFLENTYQARQSVLGHTAAWNDIENREGTPIISISTRRIQAQSWHLTINKEVRKDGAYCSPSLWQSLMGNDLLSKYGDGWVAHWTPASSPSLPVGWTDVETRIWQTGVYPTYYWVEPVPGVLGTVDVDRWFGTEQSLRDYLGYTDPDDINARLTDLERRVSILEQA